MAVPKRLHGSPPSPEKQIGVMTIPAQMVKPSVSVHWEEWQK